LSPLVSDKRYEVRTRRLLQEPILHFLLIGIALFVVYGKVAAPNRAGMSIVVSEAMVDELAREHEARWTRKPSDQELAGLVDAYVRDEILYREGLALGLDRDDALIKRRVRQKFEVIAEEQSAREAPSDADLAAYVTQNAGRFLLPATVSFEQIFFDNGRIPADVERAVAAARVALAHGADPRKLGQASMLPSRVDNAEQDLVARDFGTGFAGQVETAPLGQWSGPIASSFGAHLVRVSARTPTALPELDGIRRIVAREWENERRVSSRSDSYQKLRGQYTVLIEGTKLTSLAARR
jgi:parvulin-like peptidyl-prolyl isomerase